VTTTDDCGFKAHGRQMVTCGQTTTSGFLAVSMGALEMVDRYSQHLTSVLALPGFSY